MVSLSLYCQFETNLMSNSKIMKLLLQLKSAKAHGKRVKSQYLECYGGDNQRFSLLKNSIDHYSIVIIT